MATETGLTKFNNVFVPMIERQMSTNDMQMSDYQKLCVMGASQHIYDMVQSNNLDTNFIKGDVSNILMTISALQLNANAEPREIYFQTRNVKDGGQWKKTIEMGIEGDGNDAILARFGRRVKYVHPFWAIREHDEYIPAKHKGTTLTEPEWIENSEPGAKVVRVVYAIDFWTDDDHKEFTTEYFTKSREDVKPNLLAHINNNLMKERRNQPAAYDKKMEQIREFAREHSIDEMLDDPEIVKLGNISDAWTSPQSRESMLIRKMRNNIVKKIPKDFSNGLVQEQYQTVSDETHRKVVSEISEQSNSEDFDVPAPEAVDENNNPVEVETEEASEKKHTFTADPKAETKVSGTETESEAEPF